MEYFLLGVIGLATGGLSGLFGVGGGFILIPLLTLTGISIKTAIALSLLYIVGTAISGLIRHFKQHTVDVVLAASLSLSSILTAQLGAKLAVGLPAHLLNIMFGVLTATVAIYYLFRSDTKELITGTFKKKNKFEIGRQKTVAKKEYTYKVNLLIGLAIGAVVGFLSGLFGVGGGFLMVPLMVTVMGIPLKIAVGTSLLCVLPPALSGALSLALSGHLELDALPLLLLGGLIGAQIGAWSLPKFKENHLKLAFNLLLLGVSTYMLALGLVG
jgi:hypothetical protein